MNKIAYIAALALVPAMVAPAQEDMSQFTTPAQRFGHGQFQLSKDFVEIVEQAEADPEAAADKIDRLTEEAKTLNDLKGKIDQAELLDIQKRLMGTPEYRDIQTRGANNGLKLKQTQYFGSERLRSSIQEFFFTVMGFSRAN